VRARLCRRATHIRQGQQFVEAVGANDCQAAIARPAAVGWATATFAAKPTTHHEQRPHVVSPTTSVAAVCTSPGGHVSRVPSALGTRGDRLPRERPVGLSGEAGADEGSRDDVRAGGDRGQAILDVPERGTGGPAGNRSPGTSVLSVCTSCEVPVSVRGGDRF
jgi:hypothetical protein